MQIANARKTAERYLSQHMIESRAKRPDPDQKVMTRYPARNGTLILAADQDKLVEKLAKKIQTVAKKATVH